MNTILKRIMQWGMIFTIGFALFNLQTAWAGNISETHKFGWSENAGWQNWRSTNAQATVEPSYLTGYVWAENIGWVKLGVDAGGPYANTDQTSWGVNHDTSTGALSGYAWSENAGWINFSPTHGGVSISTSTNKFDGYAWGERVGWIHFQNASPEYYVMQQVGAPTVTTQPVTDITTTTATGNGNITALGAPNPTQHGVCWNTTGSPTTSDSKTQDGAVSATGSFTSSMIGLSPNTTYHVRAYATNTAGTAYGDEVNFITNPQVPTVTTQAVTGIGTTTATGNGNIRVLGAPNPIQHGVCWNTAGNPTIADSKTEEGAASATGAFTSDMTGLSPNTTYYVRAYATNTAGTAYGDEVNFTTGATTITDFNPKTGSAGATVVIEGTHFTGTEVKFGGTDAASFTVDSANQITAVVGAGSTGYVTVTTDGGTGTSASLFTYDDDPATLATGTPGSYKVTVTKVEMFNGTAWVTIFTGTAQLDMAAGGTFPGIRDLNLSNGVYSQVRVTFNNAFPVSGTVTYSGTPCYTTATAFFGQVNLASTPTTVAGSMAAFIFRNPAWGDLNADVRQTYAITPIVVGEGTDYQPTLRFTISNTLLLKGTAGNASSYFFSLNAPTVALVEP